MGCAAPLWVALLTASVGCASSRSQLPGPRSQLPGPRSQVPGPRSHAAPLWAARRLRGLRGAADRFRVLRGAAGSFSGPCLCTAFAGPSSPTQASLVHAGKLLCVGRRVLLGALAGSVPAGARNSSVARQSPPPREFQGLGWEFSGPRLGILRASAGGVHWSPLRWFVQHFNLRKDKGRDDECRRERFT